MRSHLSATRRRLSRLRTSWGLTPWGARLLLAAAIVAGFLVGWLAMDHIYPAGAQPAAARPDVSLDLIQRCANRLAEEGDLSFSEATAVCGCLFTTANPIHAAHELQRAPDTGCFWRAAQRRLCRDTEAITPRSGGIPAAV